MRALTGPGLQPLVASIARLRRVSEERVWQEREQAAFDLLAAACHERLVQSAADLAAYQAEFGAAMTSRSRP